MTDTAGERIEERWAELVDAADEGRLWEAIEAVPTVAEQKAALDRERDRG